MKMMKTTLTATLLCLSLVPSTALAQGGSVEQNTPSAVARESFEALKRLDLAAYASRFHPDEIRRFKAFAVDVFRYERPDDEVRQLRKSLAPFNTAESVAVADGSDLLAAFLKNSLTSIPGFEALLEAAKLEILGEIAETPDTVHVVTRSITPRPQPVSCRKHDGRWYQLFDDAVMRTLTAFEQKERFRKQNLTFEEVIRKAAIGKIDVIGHVQDGADTAQVLCRFNMKIEDFDLPMFKCYPVRKGEPAWDHLNDSNKIKLVEALRSKWGI
jgi:hypothetical protein